MVNMKAKSLVIVAIIAMIVSMSCTRRVVVVQRNSIHRVPPGQAKKITGSQSAKPYAPGQQKRKG